MDDAHTRQQELVRIAASVLGCGLIFGALGAAFVYWRSKDPDLVSLPPGTSPALLEAIRQDAAGASLVWWLIAVGVVGTGALFWLVWAFLTRPATPRDQRSLVLPWLVLMIVALVASFAVGFGVYANNGIAAKWRFLLCVTILIGVPIDFVLTTAIGVKNSMIPSAPFSRFMRR